MRNISWRLLKIFFTGKKPAVVVPVVAPSSSGSLLMMSFIYVADTGLIRFAGIDVTGSDPAGQPPLATVMQTGCGTPAGVVRSNRPASIPLVGRVGLNVL